MKRGNTLVITECDSQRALLAVLMQVRMSYSRLLRPVSLATRWLRDHGHLNGDVLQLILLRGRENTRVVYKSSLTNSCITALRFELHRQESNVRPKQKELEHSNEPHYTFMFVCVKLLGFHKIVTHEAKPPFLFLTVAKQVKETHLLQLSLETVQGCEPLDTLILGAQSASGLTLVKREKTLRKGSMPSVMFTLPSIAHCSGMGICCSVSRQNSLMASILSLKWMKSLSASSRSSVPLLSPPSASLAALSRAAGTAIEASPFGFLSTGGVASRFCEIMSVLEKVLSGLGSEPSASSPPVSELMERDRTAWRARLLDLRETRQQKHSPWPGSLPAAAALTPDLPREDIHEETAGTPHPPCNSECLCPPHLPSVAVLSSSRLPSSRAIAVNELLILRVAVGERSDLQQQRVVKAVVHAAQAGHQVDQHAAGMSLERGGDTERKMLFKICGRMELSEEPENTDVRGVRREFKPPGVPAALSGG
ncbi:hypothetical protein EYF80_017209 [Liparis tanakae]|uniref:Uncharacterized protein n=1 Tax=Liparis tanakae TaxID=230148 RepID=A0A4Z2I5Q1_9TELE|nr:hypothetical protein EYF80_017209 [Liparis tanakae]